MNDTGFGTILPSVQPTPLDTGNPEVRKYYMDFSSVRGGNTIWELGRTITRLSPDKPSCQLFTGHSCDYRGFIAFSIQLSAISFFACLAELRFHACVLYLIQLRSAILKKLYSYFPSKSKSSISPTPG
ncbi:MAG TPA: hypothetical protein V6C85_10750 [Allocoleopsis sp.]